MREQFSRTALLLGWENMEKLKSSRVAVFGLGGVGGHCAEALCRAGIGALDLFDADIVDITNLNRQIIATHKTIGRDKVDVMRERLLEINPEAIIETYKLFYLPEVADEVLLTPYDYIVDAIDTIAAKIELVCRATALGVPVISSMGAANKLDPTAFEVLDIYDTSVCPIARIMRNELRKRGVGALKTVCSKETPIKPLTPFVTVVQHDAGVSPTMRQSDPDVMPSPKEHCQYRSAPRRISDNRQLPASNSFVPPIAGLIIASEVVKDLLAL